MEFDTQAQEDLYARTAMHLRTAFGELAQPIGDGPDFRVDISRTPVLVSVAANGPEKSSLQLYAIIADGLTITDDVTWFLLKKNQELPFGTFSLNDDDEIVIKDLILSEAATKDNVAMVVQTIASDADEVEDELNMRFR